MAFLFGPHTGAKLKVKSDFNYLYINLLQTIKVCAAFSVLQGRQKFHLTTFLQTNKQDFLSILLH